MEFWIRVVGHTHERIIEIAAVGGGDKRGGAIKMSQGARHTPEMAVAGLPRQELGSGSIYDVTASNEQPSETAPGVSQFGRAITPG